MTENEKAGSRNREMCLNQVDPPYTRRLILCHREPHDDLSWHEELYRADTGETSSIRWSPADPQYLGEYPDLNGLSGLLRSSVHGPLSATYRRKTGLDIPFEERRGASRAKRSWDRHVDQALAIVEEEDSDQDLPGMWEPADYLGGAPDEVRGHDWTRS